jgi:hypothetical protein
MRFKIEGQRQGGWDDPDTYPHTRYVNAVNAEAAREKAGPLLVSVDRVTEVPWEEGRGVLWWIFHWLKII